MRGDRCKRSSHCTGMYLEFSMEGYVKFQYNRMRFLGMTWFLNRHAFFYGMRVRCVLLKKCEWLYAIVTSFVSFVRIFAKKDKSELFYWIRIKCSSDWFSVSGFRRKRCSHHYVCVLLQSKMFSTILCSPFSV